MKKIFALSLCIFMLVAAVRADTSDIVLDKHIEAIGGMDAIMSVRSIVMTGMTKVGGIEMGLKEIYKAPFFLYEEDTILGRKSSTVFDGREGWVLDVNGQVQRLDGEEVQIVKTELVFFGLTYITDKTLRKHYKYMGVDPETSEIKLEFHPSSGLSATLYFDSDSYLINRIVQVRSGETISAYQTEYREVQGVKLPHRIRITNGKEKYDQIVLATEFQINGDVDENVFRKPQARQSYTWSSGKLRVEAPIEFDGMHIYATLKMNGKPVRMLVDTGAGMNLILPKTTEKLGLKPIGAFEVKGGGGSIDGALVEGVDIQVGHLTLKNQMVSEIDLQVFDNIDGVLGYDFFSWFIVAFDYQKQMMTMSDARLRTSDKRGKTAALYLDGRTPHIKGAVDGLPLMIRLDTGAEGGLILDKSFWKKHKLDEKYPDHKSSVSMGVGGAYKETIRRVNEISIGGYTLRNQQVSFSEDDSTSEAVYVQGNAGNDLLSRFTVILDYPAQKATLIPNSDFTRQDQYTTGIVLQATDNGLMILIVEDQSPAKKAGLMPGDLLLSVNGIKSSGKKAEDVQQWLVSGKPKLYKLKVKRQGKALDVKFRSEQLLSEF